MMKGMRATAVLGVVGIAAIAVVGFTTMGVNDAGYTTIVQYPTGTMKVHTDPGWYLKWFGNTTVYNKQITMDADRSTADTGATIDQPGIAVRYSDGGTGTIYGKMRFQLPEVKEDMLKIHAAFRTNKGVAFKLIKSVSEEAVNQTAGLMKSEEAFDAKRAVFTQWAKAQIKGGLFQTEAQWITETDEVTGKTISKQIAKVRMEKGQPMHYPSDLAKYNIQLVGFQLNNPDFEPKTVAQIEKKRKATMDIITAKANAEKAKQDAITAEEQGKADVMTERYAKLVVKEAAVVEAERKATVARISAQQKVTVAMEALKEAEQYKLKQEQLKQANILEGEGLAEKKRLLMEADGALEQKLAAVVEINKAYAREFGKQKWVSEISMGSTGVSGDNTAATDLIQLLTVNAAKAVNADLTVK